MTTEQLQEFARLTAATHQLVAQLRTIARKRSASDLRAHARVLTEMESEVCALTVWIQEELLLEKRSPVTRQTSSPIDHGVPVRRYDMGGRPLVERNSDAPVPSGRWQSGRLGVPKPRRPWKFSEER